ncbi:hypothetical protein E3U55_10065 [Filobacillus milosensis]|uniref:Uncharacterized protein n=1 Tax=Filobacillus milosensis TaxID=94137 RepID=A0A4Y8IG65_9BACI|nr:hypothetical protein [Filobacillus milosensis]TFB19501.1 hypothetical protein E3U55_10065 [Filobacillus milosensis]
MFENMFLYIVLTVFLVAVFVITLRTPSQKTNQEKLDMSEEKLRGIEEMREKQLEVNQEILKELREIKEELRK